MEVELLCVFFYPFNACFSLLSLEFLEYSSLILSICTVVNECEIHSLWACVHTQGYFFLPIHCMKELLPCMPFGFSQKALWKERQEGSQKCRKKNKLGRVLQCLHCSGKSINPSLQTVMKARVHRFFFLSQHHKPNNFALS